MGSQTRRDLLRQAATIGVAAPAFIRNLLSAPPSDRVRFASFGAGNMAYQTLDGIATHANAKLVCVAEVDQERLANLNRKYAGTQVYEDWRRLLDKERKNLDAVCVATPDHMHAPIAMRAMQAGLHAYVQKPLAQNIKEVRKLTELAKKKKLVTQMGIQIHSYAQYKNGVQLIRDGAIGKVKQVYSWSFKEWGDPAPIPHRNDPVPAGFNWDLWLGVAAPRPYIEEYYHPGNWRKRTDFGTATFGDMGCHIYDPVFWALELTAPISVRSEGVAPTKENWALNSLIHYVFPETRYTEGPVKVTWHDGTQQPPEEIWATFGERRRPREGSMFMGTKGQLLMPHFTTPILLPDDQYKDYVQPQLTADNHYHQFVDAIQGKTKTTTAFDYSGPLTESVLLGPLASHFPNTTLEWDAKRLKFTNVREANQYVGRRYRKGWKVKGI
jgi:predicted dehydrogenase